MRATLLDAKNSSISGVLGYNACDPRFTQAVNEAQQRIVLAGRWENLITKLRVCVIDGCITWPRQVMTVEGFNICRYSIPLRNKWFEFQENVVAPKVGTGCSCDQTQLIDRNESPVLRDIALPAYVRIYPTSATDAGKKILIQGKDPNGVPIRTLSGSTWVDGEYVTLAYPFATSTHLFQGKITGVQKPLTNSYVTMFSVDQATTVETMLAYYEPSETNPSYRKSYIVNLPKICATSGVTNIGCTSNCTDNGDGCEDPMLNCTNIVADVLVRLQFVPVVSDSDWLMVGNVNALKKCIMAMQYEDKNDMDLAEKNWQMCLRLLRDEMNAYYPPEETVINAEVMGTAHMRYVMGGFI